VPYVNIVPRNKLGDHKIERNSSGAIQMLVAIKVLLCLSTAVLINLIFAKHPAQA
jgi:hypothetical protein